MKEIDDAKKSFIFDYDLFPSTSAGDGFVLKINKYKNFIEMLKAEGLRNVAPNLSSIEEADKVYHTYFKEYQIKKYGVCAIHLKIIS